MLLSDQKLNNQIVNIGATQEFSIKFFAKKICEIINYDFKKVIFDTSKYVGSKSKKLSTVKISKIINNYKFKLISLEKGLKLSIKSYIKNYLNE